MSSSAMPFADSPATVHRAVKIVLKPLSHPEYGAIYVENKMLAVGRSEAPFDSYSPEIVERLSRQHAKIFFDGGAAYLADFGSKYGTSVNGVAIRAKPETVRDGDEICFGGVLSYRVHLARRAVVAACEPPKLTLIPECNDLRLESIVVARYPFLISRTEETVARYADEFPHQVNYVSRRHAQFFLKGGVPFIEDLGSKNGTFVGGERLGEDPVALQDGDMVGFGGKHFVYRVSLETKSPSTATRAAVSAAPQEKTDPRLAEASRAARSSEISLADQEQPEPVVGAAGPGTPVDSPAQAKTDPGFSNAPPAAVLAAVDSLSQDKPAAEAAKLSAVVPVVEADSIVHEKSAPVVDKPSPVEAAPSGPYAGHDKTMFVVAGASFLDIFCGDQAQPPQSATPDEGKKIVEVKQQTDKPRERGSLALFLSELREAFAGSERRRSSQPLWWSALLVAVLAVVALFIYFGGASQRQVKDLFVRGEYGRAAAAANRYLEKHPDDAEIKALSTEALLKAHVPAWVALLTKNDFDRARGALASMREASARNENVKSWVSDLEWLSDLQKFIVDRGGPDAPIRMYGDEPRIKSLLKYWNDDTQAHQRSFATIASYVPEFRDIYAETLSHLRKLQSDDSVYLTAIERLNSAIGTELNRETPDALDSVFNEYSEKYPRLAGLDRLREDLRQYLAIEERVRARRLGPLMTLRAKMRFSTPRFEAKFRSLISSERFPPASLADQYAVVSQAWREGDARRAISALQSMRTGAWSDAAALEQEHKKAIIDQYTSLQNSRNANGYEERLMSFYGALDPDEDEYFIRSIKAEVAVHKDKVLARANEAASRAETMWRRYQDNGAITGRQRLEGEVSSQFRMQARLLSEAERNARQGIRIYSQLKLGHPAQWDKTHEEINAEAEMQRKSLLDLRKVLEPRLFKAKLELLEGKTDD